MPIDVADFHFYSNPEYFAQLVERIQRAKVGDRATLATMAFEPGQAAIHRVVDELRLAAGRGVIVHLLVDARQLLMGQSRWFGEATPGPLIFNSELPLRLRGQFKIIFEALEALQDAGGQYTITNSPGRRFSNPLAGRAHWKFACINDMVFVGGCNLDSDTHLDVMIGWKDPKTAEWLEMLADGVAKEGTVSSVVGGKDIARELSHDETLLLDAGLRGQSHIMTKSLAMIDEAQDFIVFSSQFFPRDVTSRHLKAAYERGVKVQIIYNHPLVFRWPFNVVHFFALLKSRRVLPKSFFLGAQKRDYLHAKILVTEKEALVGSHNFVTLGVKLGTAELDISSRSPVFSRRLLETLERQVDGNVIGIG